MTRDETLKLPAGKTLWYCACVRWKDVAVATPFMDFRCVRVMGEATPYHYDHTARACLNGRTLAALAGNRNAADLYGRRPTVFGRAGSFVGAVSEILAGDGLPRLVEAEWVPDDTVLVIPAGAPTPTAMTGLPPGAVVMRV